MTVKYLLIFSLFFICKIYFDTTGVSILLMYRNSSLLHQYIWWAQFFFNLHIVHVLSQSWMIGIWMNNCYFVSAEESGQLLTDLERNKDQRKAFWTQITLTLYWWTMGHSTSLEWRSHSEPGWKNPLLPWKPTPGKVSENNIKEKQV